MEIKAHANDHFAKVPAYVPKWEKIWKGKQPAGHSLDCCSCCGSLSPVALLDALKAGARLDPADWKGQAALSRQAAEVGSRRCRCLWRRKRSR
jgi:hypothetical protein